MIINGVQIKGLSQHGVALSQSEHGKNIIVFEEDSSLVNLLKKLIAEPLVGLLIAISVLYFFLGEISDAIFLLVAVVVVALISIFQDNRTDTALKNLATKSASLCTVLRDNIIVKMNVEDIVVGDIVIVEEGSIVPADGKLLQCNDLTINEAILTGESLPIAKDLSTDNKVYKGCTVIAGLGIFEVRQVGAQTQMGSISTSILNIEKGQTKLEIQINRFVRRMVFVGLAVFGLVLISNYWHSNLFLESLVVALTMTLSIIPEEIPVAFTTFMALGTWRLAQNGVIVKSMKTVESLGTATVLCLDKTGTITENQMTLTTLHAPIGEYSFDLNIPFSSEHNKLLCFGQLASEPIAFDQMEKAIDQRYAELDLENTSAYQMIHEYPLGGKPPMMTHIYKDKTNETIIAAKGAVEALLEVSNLSQEEKKKILEAAEAYASEGKRVLAVGEGTLNDTIFPRHQQDIRFNYLGLLVFEDPPKKNVMTVFNSLYKAGVDLKIVTGDHLKTTQAIAKKIGFKGYENAIDGKQLMTLSDHEIYQSIKENSIFSRMFPEAKLRLVQALQNKNETLAMIGDGVNDAPALKAADVGIAMGTKGTDVAKESADIIIINDDLKYIVDAVAAGRNVYSNLKRAIQYVISIHIPLIMVVSLPILFSWEYSILFTPIHVIFLELVMGPTCSVVFENEPLEKSEMLRPPQKQAISFLNWSELSICVLQGLVIGLGFTVLYFLGINWGLNVSLIRSMIFVYLVISNVFLTLVFRSFTVSLFKSIFIKNNLVPIVITAALGMMSLIFFIPSWRSFFGFEVMSFHLWLICIGISFIAVIWFEVYKWYRRGDFSFLPFGEKTFN